MATGTAPLWWQFTRTAIVWLIPAALLLPVVLLFVGLAAVSADGSLLEVGSGIRGKLLTALGPLLIISAGGVIVFASMAARNTNDWIGAGAFAVTLVAVGVYAIARAVRELQRGR